jgi:hypothetical protein
MRSILTLIVLACIPALCQPVFCQDAGQKLNDNLRQRLTDMLNSQAQLSGNTVAPRPLPMTVTPPTPQLCSIPLLNVSAPGKPVPMPNLMPRALPSPGLIPTPNTPTPAPRVLDRMSIVVPAPACPANFGQTVEPVPAPMPFTKP